MWASPTTVLLIDDGPDVGARVAGLLRESGLAVVGPLSTIADALQAFDRVRPAAAVLEIGTEDMRGLELLGQMRARRPECPVLVLTSHDEPSLHAECLQRGASRVLCKDRGMGEFVDALRAQLRR